jgi:hypothetical protein
MRAAENSSSSTPGGLCAVALAVILSVPLAAWSAEPLRIDWQDGMLTIVAPHLPGHDVRIHYLEAYCRSGSTDRPWDQTVIPHTSRRRDDGSGPIELEDRLADGVIVRHTITASTDEVDFRVEAHNPTDQPSDAQWAQPCMRVDRFTGTSTQDARLLYPPYIRQCFLYVDGRPTRLPTEPWATDALYTPGQVYCPAPVDRRDVNPRPLSSIVPSHGLCGCYSQDGQWILATAWHPFQEIFQGVITCLHNDFRIGGLAPGETKTVRGKLYLMPADRHELERRYREDFPAEAEGIGGPTEDGDA